jgi:hypothetical protein
VEASCEKALFANPETTAAALSFVEMQLALLARGAELAGQEANEPATLAGIRRAVETDRYGLVAQVFAARHGCASEHCRAFLMLRDAARVKANLKAAKYDTVVRRYGAAWPAGTAPVLASAPPASSGIPYMPAATSVGMSGIDFPSAASIPPISIMNSEPPAAESAAAQARTEAPSPPAVAAATRQPAPAPAQPRRPTVGQNGAVPYAPLPPPMNLQSPAVQ